MRPVSDLSTTFADPFTCRCPPQGSPHTGPLAGATIAVKDNIDVAGLATTAGNPQFAAQRALPQVSAPVVETLIAAGALVVGKTIMDEFAYGADGVNAHYGTPANPAAPGRTCGGSSCGSASAVAAGLASIGLGTDTGGSTRIPPAATGLFGLRPTHGRVSAAGVVPLAPSFDTVGWMTRDAALLERVTHVLLPSATRATKPLVLVHAFFDAADMDLAGGAEAAARKLGAVDQVQLDCSLSALMELYVGLTRAEIRTAFAWMSTNPIPLGLPVAPRFEAAFAAAGRDLSALLQERARLRERMQALLSTCMLVFPTLATRTPRIDASSTKRDQARGRILPATVLAPLIGAPEITLPVGRVDSGGDTFPAALSILGAPDDEWALCALARKFADAHC